MTARFQNLLLGVLCVTAAAACGGDDGPCEPESDAALCEQADADCGTLTKPDRCGGERVLACGECVEPLWCGGGGEPNRCGATCVVGCPDGWTCELDTCVGGSPARIPLAIEAVQVGGTVLLEGTTPTAGERCAGSRASISFHETHTGASTTALVPCESADFGFEAVVAPGTYEVWLRADGESSSLPPGSFLVEAALAVEGPRSDLRLDVRTVEVAGRITLDGVAPGANLICEGDTTTVLLEETTTGTRAWSSIPCDDADFSFSVRVPPGTYDVLSRKESGGGSNLPDGSAVLATGLRIDGPASGLVFDIPTSMVSGRLTRAGELPEAGVACVGDAATVEFREVSTGAWFHAPIRCDAEDFAFGLRLPPGTYEVSVKERTPDASDLPQGTVVVNPALRVDAPADGLVFDVRAVPVSGQVRWSALSDPSSFCSSLLATLLFTSTENGSYLLYRLPCDAALAFDVELATGTYVVTFGPMPLPESSLPGGNLVLERSFRVDGPQTGILLEAQAAPVSVSGTVRVNGAPPVSSAGCVDHAAKVTFTEARRPSDPSIGRNSATARVPCGATEFAWSTPMPPGDYQVIVSPYGSEASSLPDGQFVAVDRIAIR